MVKTFEQALSKLTGEQMLSLASQAWIALGGAETGEENIQRLLAGELRFNFEKPVELPELLGTEHKRLLLKPYQAASVAKAVAEGKYHDRAVNISRLFSGGKVELSEPVTVKLVMFNRRAIYKEIMVWAEKHQYKPIETKHILAIGIQYPHEQYSTYIVALGTIRSGRVLYLGGFNDHRTLFHEATDGNYWDPSYQLFGFIGEMTGIWDSSPRNKMKEG